MNVENIIKERLNLCWNHNNKECVMNTLQELIVYDEADLTDYFILSRLFLERENYQQAIITLSSYISLSLKEIKQIKSFVSNNREFEGEEYYLNIAYLLRGYAYASIGQKEKALADIKFMNICSKESILDNALWIKNKYITYQYILGLIHNI